MSATMEMPTNIKAAVTVKVVKLIILSKILILLFNIYPTIALPAVTLNIFVLS